MLLTKLIENSGHLSIDPVKLPESFYRKADVARVARDLLGKLLVSNSGGRRTSGFIVETEAYGGVRDRASHAWNGRHTDRT
ncbi:MAG: DNA-3-methyladenine glycosylase, partial [Calditrichaeota bacterium]|nr:DNA-3-methyladenine glycosylase [Calditrichota bacterium]